MNKIIIFIFMIFILISNVLAWNADRTIQTDGSTANVVISVDGSSTTTYAIEETMPSGCSATNINEGGVYNSGDRKIRWVFLDNNNRALTYRTVCSSGVVSGIISGGSPATTKTITGDNDFSTNPCLPLHNSYQCLSNKIYWLDACGSPNDIKENCASGCVNGQTTCGGTLYCGDGVCSASESCSSCLQDCGSCSNDELDGYIIGANVNRIALGDQIIVGTRWTSDTGGTFVLEGQISSTTDTFSTANINQNVCDANDDWHYRTQFITFAVGETKDVNFIFTPEHQGYFRYYIAGFDQCGPNYQTLQPMVTGGLFQVMPTWYCTLDTDCSPGYECEGNSCIVVDTPCTTDAQCGSGKVCNAGVCITAPSNCDITKFPQKYINEWFNVADCEDAQLYGWLAIVGVLVIFLIILKSK